MKKLGGLLFLSFFLSVTSAFAQARIGLDGKSKITSASPLERPNSSTLYTQADTVCYRKLVTEAYHALEDDSFALAKKKFEEALNAVPRMDTNVEVLYELGQLEEREGRQQSAIQFYTRAIKKNGNYVKAYLRRGGMYLLLDETENAVKDFNEVTRLDANNTDAMFFRGCAFANAGQYGLASKDFEEMLKHNALDERATYSLALVESQEGKLQDALIRMNGLILRHESNCQYYALRADISEKMNSLDAAEKDWQKAFELSPKDVSMVEGYALYLARHKRKDDALQVIDRAQNSGIPSAELEDLRNQVKKYKSK